MAEITKSEFGRLQNGSMVYLYTLKNSSGASDGIIPTVQGYRASWYLTGTARCRISCGALTMPQATKQKPFTWVPL